MPVVVQAQMVLQGFAQQTLSQQEPAAGDVASHHIGDSGDAVLPDVAQEIDTQVDPADRRLGLTFGFDQAELVTDYFSTFSQGGLHPVRASDPYPELLRLGRSGLSPLA